MRNELRLRAEEWFQECAGQSCVVPMMFKVLDTLFLVGNVLLATQRAQLVQDAEAAGPIHLALLAMGGSAIGLSATGAYGQSLSR
ncbi:hypothetical protein [Bradyrhizobium centrolobii]|uniref:hypothetical protein n=1 Tax=Bradyrhizobium centrolobii TaxID=1505087 RepID=UPI000A43C26A|nr:hypothetical protein [Bradyrhizobium centrolobii]